MIGLAWWLAFWLRFNFEIPDEFERLAILGMPGMLVCFAIGLAIARVHRQIWRYTGLPELRQLVWGVGLGAIFSAALVLMLRYPAFPRSVLLLHPLVTIIFLGGARAARRTLAEKDAASATSRPLLIIGSLQQAAIALRALKGSRQWHCVGIASPVPSELGRYLHQVPVLGLASAIADISAATGAEII
ncbi:MAG: polysaccharide biosynthesis protein, partial [Comamonadaceae bacterium]